MEQIKCRELAEVMAYAEQPHRDFALHEFARGNAPAAEAAILNAETAALAEGRRYVRALDAILASYENRFESPAYIGIEDLKKFGTQFNYPKNLPGRIWRSLVDAHASQISLFVMRFVSPSDASHQSENAYQLELHSLMRVLNVIAAELPKQQNNRYYLAAMIGPRSSKITYEFLWAFVREYFKDQPDSAIN